MALEYIKLLYDPPLANSAGDNSYRYAGANPNNYVCFGSTASTCPSANLYRIDIMILLLLLMLDMLYLLLHSYLLLLILLLHNKIATTTWNVGGMEAAKMLSPSTIKTIYNYEVGANKYLISVYSYDSI